jgi:hypothetical protein
MIQFLMCISARETPTVRRQPDALRDSAWPKSAMKTVTNVISMVLAITAVARAVEDGVNVALGKIILP